MRGNDKATKEAEVTVKETKRKKKGGSASTAGGGISLLPPPDNVNCAPLSLVSPSFILSVVPASFDSLTPPVGTSVHLTDPSNSNKVVRGDIPPRFERFVSGYVEVLLSGDGKRGEPTASTAPPRPELEDFVRGMLSERFIRRLKPRTMDRALKSVTSTLLRSETNRLPVSYDVVEEAVDAFRDLYAMGSLVPKLKASMSGHFAVLLSCSYDTSQKNSPPDPMLVLKVLTLYPTPLSGGEEDEEQEEWGPLAGADSDAAINGGDSLPELQSEGTKIREALRSWLSSIGTLDRQPGIDTR